MALITIQQIRDEGVTVQDADDARLALIIGYATAFINRVTRQFFEAKVMTLKLDGSGKPLLHLPIFCADLTALTVNGADVLKSVTNYNRIFPVDDRLNPKLVFTNGGCFTEGFQNVSVTGVFGYVEVDPGPVYSVPLEIQDACKRLVILTFPLLTKQKGGMGGGGGGGGVGGIIEESFDSGTYSYKKAEGTPSPSQFENLWTSDSAVNQVLLNYQKPICGTII